MSIHTILLFYVLLIAPISIILFLYGFFPIAHHVSTIATREDIPLYIENIKVQADTLYKPIVRRLVIMVIDALRWDFVAGPIGKITMPVINNLVKNSSGCLLKVKLQSPTVTMPRIKAMMTGMVPNFVDVILNFGSDPLTSDNLLLQAKKHGHKLIFYGDNTWLSLFPDIFERYDGTTSFFVTDFYEVDNNVTRHVQDELNNDDWSIMILHYLGLDHIGHVEGPFSLSVKSKLKEMDDIIAQIIQKVQYWNNNNNPTLFIVCGDHGMKDSGGHGGSTLQETTVALVAMGQTRCSYQKQDELIEIEQLDLAATLSVALGLPIPSTNLGSIFLNNIYKLADSKQLFLLYYNSKQVFNHFQNLVDYDLQQTIYQKYSNVVTMHVNWLNTNDKPNKMVKNIISSYNTILKEMRKILINSMIKYDVFLVISAILCLCHVLCILFIVRNPIWVTDKRIAFFFLLNSSLLLSTYYFVDLGSTILSYTTSIFHISLIVLIMSILYINCHLLASVKCNNLSVIKVVKWAKKKIRVFHIATLLHALSFFGSSFIEEEHQTWYFFWASLLICLLFHCFEKFLTAYHQHNSTHPFYIKVCIKLLLLLIGHRILRNLNSTGDKYAYLPDIVDWLKQDDSKVGMTFLLFTALILLTWIAHKCENKKYKQQSLIFNAAIAICIYLRHASNGAVVKIPLCPASSGIYEVQIFWGITILFVVHRSSRIRCIIRHNKKHFMSTILSFIINIWVMISAMLHQPYNVILLPMQIIISSTINTILKINNFPKLNVFVHYWLGNVFYFYQGNSNSLANIDIAAGYVGLRSYISFLTGAFLIINTYSAPILAYFLLIYYEQLNQAHCDSAVRISRIYITWRLLAMTIYTIIITIQRHHLFIWSVFSPKLLYEATYSVTMCCCVMLLLIIIILQENPHEEDLCGKNV